MQAEATPIWYAASIDLEALNASRSGTMGEWLDIRFTEAGPDFLRATMPVNERTHQPYGLLHGGASAALAETIGSVASAMVIHPQKQRCVGMEINCNHIRGKREGLVTATARPLHLGGSSHVWDIRIEDERGKIICVSRLTVAVIKGTGD